MTLVVRDALKDIGTNYTEVDMDDFLARGVVIERWDKIP